MCMLEIKPEIKNRIMTHDRAIVAARYLIKQKQVDRNASIKTKIKSINIFDLGDDRLSSG